MINNVDLTPLDKLRACHLLGLLNGLYGRNSVKSGDMQVPIRPVLKLDDTVTPLPSETLTELSEAEAVIDLSELMKALDEHK